MRKIDFRIYIIIVLTIILAVMMFFYFKDDSSSNFNDSFTRRTNTSKTTNSTKVTITSKAQVQSALEDTLELRAKYYFKEIYYEENEIIKKGSKILKYTNGKYLYAPYDLVITSKNIPSKKGKVTNQHYLKVSSVNALKVMINVSESKINNISLGQEATIKISALNDKKYEGIVTNISSTASNGKFTVTIEFDNDGEVLIGMTSEVTIEKDA